MYRMYLDLGRWIIKQGLHGAGVDPRPEGASLLQDRPSLLQRQSTSQGNMGDSEPPETCAYMSIIYTLHDQSFSLTSEDIKDSKPPVTGS